MPSSEDPIEPEPFDESSPPSPQEKEASKKTPPGLPEGRSKPSGDAASPSPRSRLEQKQSKAKKEQDAYFEEMLRPPEPEKRTAGHRPYKDRGPANTLESLLDGDPLEIWDRCEEYLEEEHYIIDVERLAMRATARTAFALHSYDDREDFELFMMDLVRKSARELLDEDLYGRPRHSLKDRTPNPLLIFTEDDVKKADALRNRLNASPRLQRAALILVDLDLIPIPKAAASLSVSEDVLFEALEEARKLL